MSLLPGLNSWVGVLTETDIQGNGQGATMLESWARRASWPLGSLGQDWAVGVLPGTTQEPVLQE